MSLPTSLALANQSLLLRSSTWLPYRFGINAGLIVVWSIWSYSMIVSLAWRRFYSTVSIMSSKKWVKGGKETRQGGNQKEHWPQVERKQAPVMWVRISWHFQLQKWCETGIDVINTYSPNHEDGFNRILKHKSTFCLSSSIRFIIRRVSCSSYVRYEINQSLVFLRRPRRLSTASVFMRYRHRKAV